MSTAKVLPFPGVVHHKISGPSRGLATHGEEREPSPGSAWPWIIFSGGEEGMTVSRFISGKDILNRWLGAPFELVGAMLSGELVAVDLASGERFTPDKNGCFFCELSDPKCEPFAESVREELAALREARERGSAMVESNRPYTHRPGVEKGRCGLPLTKTPYPKSRQQYRADIALKAQFYLSDVKAYERAHGLGPAAQVPSAPPSPLDREEAAPDREEGAKTPKEDAELMLAQGLDAGAVMLKIKDKWKITKYVAAAMALREEIPTDDEGKERMKKRWQYHTKQ